MEDSSKEVIDFQNGSPHQQVLKSARNECVTVMICENASETHTLPLFGIACDAEDCGFQLLHDDEIVTSVQEEYDPVDDKTDEAEDNSNNESSKGTSNANALSTLETSMGLYEKQSECCPSQPLLLKGIRHLAAIKEGAKLYGEISDYFTQ
ncbi:HTH CENPB-type domain-containing protein [Trichonephila clavipes]|nr:HTH CENPB-type domain-containing protein [Trichonephila clavipes]